MPETQRTYTAAENKARRLRAAEATVETAAKRLERAEARVTEAETLKAKAEEAKVALTKAERHRDWLKSMPVDDEDETAAPEADEDDGPQDGVNPATGI